ncbi:MAG: 16S rRNA (uracil(1498)-N(3))-methyltransferase [Sulfurovum sp.]
MLYLFHKDSGQTELTLTGDEHRYIFKVRRHRQGESLYLRNLKDNQIYHYLISYMDKQSASLELQKSKELDIKAKKSLHIGWCIIEPKSIEKILPSLNEIGVEKITFIYCNRSQKSFKLDFERLEKILLNSSQQSGRSDMMKLDMSEDLEKFLKDNPNSKMLNFSLNKITKSSDIDTIVIGCEGGFTPDEVAMFDDDNIYGLDTPLVLKSESAVFGVGSFLVF